MKSGGGRGGPGEGEIRLSPDSRHKKKSFAYPAIKE